MKTLLDIMRRYRLLTVMMVFILSLGLSVCFAQRGGSRKSDDGGGSSSSDSRGSGSKKSDDSNRGSDSGGRKSDSSKSDSSSDKGSRKSDSSDSSKDDSSSDKSDRGTRRSDDNNSNNDKSNGNHSNNNSDADKDSKRNSDRNNNSDNNRSNENDRNNERYNNNDKNDKSDNQRNNDRNNNSDNNDKSNNRNNDTNRGDEGPSYRNDDKSARDNNDRNNRESDDRGNKRITSPHHQNTTPRDNNDRTNYRNEQGTDDRNFRDNSQPNRGFTYDSSRVNRSLPQSRDHDKMPFLVDRQENVRVGYYRYHYDNWGYYSPNWYWNHYYYEPVYDRCVYSPFYFHVVLPGYLSLSRILYTPSVVVIRYDDDYTYRSNYDYYYLESGYYSNRSLDDAIDDIRDAWLNNDFRLFDKHLRDWGNIGIYLDKKYAYSMDVDDYKEISRDAIETVETENFRIDKVKKRSDGKYTVFGRHTYLLNDDEYRTVYVSFTLEKYGRQYYIVEAGSSSTKRLY